ncbi:GFA family protein [Pyruvatibacter mobilis]|uniref:GFA family protein n=1 Tax=Pyruvatibacter mobilis TaxID=1712261 RepID=A0A845QH25_9HYPH|nr:GFA family protein [Pyruvatibacter mobilis]QJD74730.1 GFA family protein [Pyruvatibacter mobilis]
MAPARVYEGGCLCGYIRYRTEGQPVFPHLCSCRMCRRWSGAPTVAWVEFPMDEIDWCGPGGEPQLFRSSARTQRGSCPLCGSGLCAVDDGYANVSITIGSLDRPNLIVPDARHSHARTRPKWWEARVMHSGNGGG